MPLELLTINTKIIPRKVSQLEVSIFCRSKALAEVHHFEGPKMRVRVGLKVTGQKLESGVAFESLPRDEPRGNTDWISEQRRKRIYVP